MWLMTTEGFFSAVADRNDDDFVLVRSRAQADSERLAAALGGADVIETPDADYRWRVRLLRETWAAFVAQQAGAIDYDNFKNAVAERQGPERAHVYGGVWSVLHRLQTGKMPSEE